MTKEYDSKVRKATQGSIVITFALSLITMVGMAALMMDLSKIYAVQTGLQNVASLASLSAVKALSNASSDMSAADRMERIRDAASYIAAQNKIPFQEEEVFINKETDVFPGIYDLNQGTFTEVSEADILTANAVKVFVRQGGKNPETRLGPAAVFGFKQVTLSANATSALLPAAMVIAFDNSASMTRGNYPTSCLTAVPSMDGNPYTERYFKTLAYSKNDVKNCRGEAPQPLYNALDAIVPAFESSMLFTTPLYRLSFLSFNSRVKTHVPFSLENRLTVKDKMDKILTEWTNYANNNAFGCPLYNANCLKFKNLEMPVSAAWPNFDPYEDGHTNIGGALETANKQLDFVQSAIPLNRGIILITDGAPDCLGPLSNPNCNQDLVGSSKVLTYVTKHVNTAVQQGYSIHTIYFDSTKGSCNSSDKTYKLLSDISNKTNGMFHCAASPEQITEGLNNIPVGIATVEVK